MGRRRKLFKFKLKKGSMASVAAVILFLLAVLSFVSFFAQAASVSPVLQDILNKIFGWSSILVPFILGVLGLLFLGRNFVFARFNTLVGLILLLAAFSGLSHLLFFRGANSFGLAELGQGGGLLGYKISTLLTRAFTGVGAFFVLFSALIISLLVIFNTSLNSTLNMLGAVLSLPVKFIKKLIPLNKEDKENKKDTKAKNQELPLNIPEAPIGIKVNQPGVTAGSDIQEFPRKEKLTVEVLPKKFTEEKPITAKPKPEIKKEPPAPDDGLVQETVKNLPAESTVWEYPPLSILSDDKGAEAERGDVSYNASVIEKTLDSFGIKARVVEVNLGPAVTQYALESAQGTKIARIKNLQNDLAMALASPTGAVRIEAPIPGKSLIGVETPNISPSTVNLKTILSSDALTKNNKARLLIALGLDVSGAPIIADIARMPHVLVAGSTGSGKSTLIHSLLASLLFRNSPDELKLILVDTKRVELTDYNDIPHLLTPVITETEKVLAALKWAVAEMERRYKLFQNAKVRNIDSYNELSGFQALPYILILVDEMADMMQMAPVEVEKTICRLAQMARATGIHLVLSTQRPSVDVLTGLIKANIPARIAFNVTSQIDSRVIIDQTGAEKLLGRGDMLYLPPESSKPRRIQGVFVSPKELHNIIEFIKKSQVKPQYQEEVTTVRVSTGDAGFEGSEDELFSQAIEVICEMERASASLLQRRLKVGYARAARLLDEMERQGIVGPADGSKPRDVLIHDPSQVSSLGPGPSDLEENSASEY